MLRRYVHSCLRQSRQTLDKGGSGVPPASTEYMTSNTAGSPFLHAVRGILAKQQPAQYPGKVGEPNAMLPGLFYFSVQRNRVPSSPFPWMRS